VVDGSRIQNAPDAPSTRRRPDTVDDARGGGDVPLCDVATAPATCMIHTGHRSSHQCYRAMV
jgi:hypothetical protein